MSVARRTSITLLCCLIALAIHAQSADEEAARRQFPITLQVEKSEVEHSGIDQQQLLQAGVMGMAPPILGFFAGTLNGERHWHFGCMAENTRYEQNPCVDMPIGTHRARWIHNRELLEVFAYDSNGAVTLRYLDVTIDPKNPPPPDDPVQNLPASPGFFSMTEKPYPLLVHVYGAVSLSLPVGELPARTDCRLTAIGSTQVNVDCRQYPPIPINRGTVEIQTSVNGHLKSLSCEAKWHWSKCSVLMPGFYEAHWKDNSDSKIVLLGYRNGKTEEVGFAVGE